MQRRVRPWRCGMAFMMGVALICSQAYAGPSHDEPSLKKAQEHERNHQWRDAAAIYETFKDGGGREGLQRCLRHIMQQRRHRERAFRDAILALKKSGQALDIYVKVLHILQTHYVERDRTEAGRLFQQGLLEMRYAAEDETFRKEYLADANPEVIAQFRQRLAEWDEGAVDDNYSARDQVRRVAKLAHERLRLPLPVVVFEFVCGACNSLDECTAYLTPSQASEMQAVLRGRFAGVGIDIAVVDEKIVIGQIHPDSPAARAFKVGDRIVRIDRRPIDPALPGDVRARLRGEPGTVVELEVQSLNDREPHTLRLERQPYMMPSVEFEKEPNEGVGYIRLLSFTETTVQELKDAVLSLQAKGMRVLVLDLRGNPGGLFKPSVEVAEMFLPEGLIVHTQSRLKEFNETHRSHNPNALLLPLVVLIDGETASSAELLAGALKENYRARLMGQPTFGKGTIQWIIPLEMVSAGVRITVARFLSPTGQPYNGRGVTPHIILEVTGDDEAVRAAAWRQAKELDGMIMMR